MIETKIKVWTKDYRPFIMGGDCHQPMACEVKATGPFPLGKGYKGYLIFSPRGKTFVVESKTGALVGSTIDEVKNDIKNAKPEFIKNQIKEAVIQSKKARKVEESYFWEKLEGTKYW